MYKTLPNRVATKAAGTKGRMMDENNRTALLLWNFEGRHPLRSEMRKEVENSKRNNMGREDIAPSSSALALTMLRG